MWRTCSGETAGVRMDRLSGVEEVERRVLAQKIFAVLSEKFNGERQ